MYINISLTLFLLNFDSAKLEERSLWFCAHLISRYGFLFGINYYILLQIGNGSTLFDEGFVFLCFHSAQWDIIMMHFIFHTKQLCYFYFQFPCGNYMNVFMNALWFLFSLFHHENLKIEMLRFCVWCKFIDFVGFDVLKYVIVGFNHSILLL